MRYVVVFAALLCANIACADPLLTKAQITKAAQKIEACLDEKLRTNGKQRACVGIVQSPCDDAITAGGEAAHATCADNETAAWDVLLNKAWTALPSYLPPARFTALKQIQVKWLDYRRVKCDFLNDHERKDSWGLMLKSLCALDETSRRTIELREILADPNLAAE